MSVVLTGDRLFNTGESGCISDRVGRRNAQKKKWFTFACWLSNKQH